MGALALAIEVADFFLVLPDLVLVSIPPFSLPFSGATSSSLSSASSTALLFFWLGGGAPFARGAASFFCTKFARRLAASLPSLEANAVSASWKRSSVAMVVALGSFNRDSGCY